MTKPNIDKRLLAYALAGGATISMPAHAGVIYYAGPDLTATTTTQLELDLDGDLTIDYTFSAVGGTGQGTTISASVTSANQFSSDPLTMGASVAGAAFSTSDMVLSQAKIAAPGSTPPLEKESGPFTNGVEAFLGLKFAVSGQTHYGWALIKPELYMSDEDGIASVTVKKFAYQDTPNVDLLAGQTAEVPEPSSLALFALGAAGIAAARRRRSVN